MAPDDEYEAGDVNTVDARRRRRRSTTYEDGDVNTVADGDDFDDETEDGEPGRATGPTATCRPACSTTSPGPSPTSPTRWWSTPRSATAAVRLQLHVAPDDMGRVIGRRGRTAQAIRTLVGVAGARDGVQTSVDIVDD